MKLVSREARKRLKGRPGTLLANNINWTSPSGPQGQDWAEIYYGQQPIPDDHAPSLKNPIRTKIPTAQEGWTPGASKAKRTQALQDLVEIHKRLRRQTGKPEIAQQALIPSTVSWVG